MRATPVLCLLVFVSAVPCVSGQESDGPTKAELPWVDTGLAEAESAKYLVAVAKGSSEVFLLESSNQRILIFDRKGRLTSEERMPLPAGGQGGSIMAFAVSPDGKSMAWCGADGVVLAHDFKFVRTVTYEDPPALPMDLAIEDDSPTILVSRNFYAPAELFPSMEHNAFVLARIDDEGKTKNFALELDLSKGDTTKASLGSQVRIAVADDGKIWVADWARYRLRELSAAGRELLEIVDPGVEEDIQEKEFDAKKHGIGEPLSGKQPPTGSSMAMTTVIRSMAVGGGLVWLLVNDPAAPNGQRLDVLDPDTEGVTPFPLPGSVPLLASVGLTGRFVVLGRAREGAPLTLDRSEMERLVQERKPDPDRILKKTVLDSEQDSAAGAAEVEGSGDQRNSAAAGASGSGG